MLRWGKMPPQLSALTPRGNQTNYVELLILSPRDIYCGVVVVFIVFNLQIASKWNALSGCRTLKINRRDATDTTYYLVLCWCPDILSPSLTISYLKSWFLLISIDFSCLAEGHAKLPGTVPMSFTKFSRLTDKFLVLRATFIPSPLRAIRALLSKNISECQWPRVSIGPKLVCKEALTLEPMDRRRENAWIQESHAS